jgi:phosphocarrier protein HPr
MLTKTLTIQNKLGLHARASAKLVKEAQRFASIIKIQKANKTVNAKSIMAIMMLAASQGTELDFSFDGADEDLALHQIETLLNNRFGEAE